MIMPLRKEIEERLSNYVIEQIRKEAKPTKVAEALAVVKYFKNMSLSTEETAQIINIVEPYREVKAKASDYDYDEMKKHPDLLITRTPTQVFVRYVGGRTLKRE